MLNEVSSTKPYLINDCQNILEMLLNVSQHSKKPVELLDFDLISVETYTKSVHSNNFQKLPKEEVDAFLSNKDNLLEPTLAIKQHYSLQVLFQKRQSFPFTLEIDNHFCKATLLLLEGFSLKNSEDFAIFYRALLREKAKNKVLIYNIDEEKKAIWQFLKTLQFPLNATYSYLIATSTNFVPTKEAELVFKKEVVKSFETVLEGDLVCEFQKPLLGKPGRNIRGDYIIPKAPKSSDECSLKYDSTTISIKEDIDKTEFIAKIGGILEYDDGFLSIKDTLQTQEVNNKTTGSLIGNIESGTTINITQADALKEAVAQGMQVQASKVNVEGNIGPNAEVRAKDIHIAGFTHQESKIYSENADVATHKGYLQGDTIKIDSLETGVVEGKRVEIKDVYGGKVYADEIFIENLHANAFLHATKKIEVMKMTKGENKFYLGAIFSPENKEVFLRLQNKQDSSIKSAIQMTKRLKEESLELQKFKNAADETRKQLLDYKEKGIKPPEFLVKKFENYHQFMQNFKAKRSKIDKLSEDFKEAKKALIEMDSKTKEAQIIIHSGWVGHNEVHYNFHTKNQDLVLLPKAGDPSKVVYEDGKLQLIPKDKA